MQDKFRITIFSILFPLLTIVFCGVSLEIRGQAGAIGMEPRRIEAVIPAGTEKTVGVTIDYSRETENAELPLARLITRLEDWTITPQGDVKFAPVSTLERSASSWVTTSASEFTLAADTKRVLRFTINVPKDTPPGDYYVAAYVENRDAPPPPKEGEKRIVVSFRHYLMIYVMVPGLTYEGELLGLKTEVVNGNPVVSPKLSNKGNSHLRPQQSFEIRDEAEKVVFSSPANEARVLLGGHSWEMPYYIDAGLPAGKYKLAYTVDFGDKKALQIGKTSFEITNEDVALREKAKQQIIAANQPDAATTQPADPAKTTVGQTTSDKETAQSKPDAPTENNLDTTKKNKP